MRNDTRYITGGHAVEEYLRNGGRGILLVSKEKALNKKAVEMKKIAENAGIPVKTISEKELRGFCGENNRGFCLSAAPGKKTGTKKSLNEYIGSIKTEHPLVLLLDGITDPHNYGAILRSAEQFGVDLVVTPTRRSSGVTGTVEKTSAGAVHHLNILEVPNLKYVIRDLKAAGFWVYGADMNGEPVHRSGISGKTALCLGSEGRGLSRIIREYTDSVISIPRLGNIDSLNVSVAAGILLYEIRKQQGLF
jgi:23S rRNA (guanosine2251-2'-O)-methyltransferase